MNKGRHVEWEGMLSGRAKIVGGHGTGTQELTKI